MIVEINININKNKNKKQHERCKNNSDVPSSISYYSRK